MNETLQNETITESSKIAAMLASLTTPGEEPLYAKETDLAVTTLSALNKYIIVTFC